MHLLAFAFLLVPAVSSLHADDWQHWRGAARDGTTKETSGWDEGHWQMPAGPKKLWEVQCGQGGSSPVTDAGRVYVAGWYKNEDTVQCFDAATGKNQWRQSYAAPRYGRHAVGDQGFYGGPSATPEFDPATGVLYTLGCDGELRAWDTAKNGAVVWKLNLYDRYQVEQRPAVTKHEDTRRDYGYTCAPLVLGDSLLVEVGSAKAGTVIAFDKRTGKELWASELRDPAGHAGGMLPLKVEGQAALGVFTSLHVALISLGEKSRGKTLALRLWPTRYANNMATLTAVENDVIVSTKWTNLTARLRPTLTNGWVTVWEAKNHGSNVTSPIFMDGHLYFALRSLTCLEAATGKLKWQGGRFNDATSLIGCADGRLIVWSNNGDLCLVDAETQSPGAFRELARLPLIRDDMAWPHVALADRRLFCRAHSGRMVCMELTK
jgi:outer membrane protein assembly factor BamB